MVLTLAALVSFASAHVPHDVIAAAALPYDLTSSQPWYVLLDEGGEHALFRSEDFGQSWDAAGGDHSVDPVTAATLLDDGTLVLLGDRRLWLSTDGESWTTEDLDFDGTGLVGRSTLYIASDDGVWVGTLGGTFTQELAGTAIASVQLGDGDPVAITDDGKVWWRKSGTWTQITIRSRDTVQTAIGTTGGVYVGTTDGRVVQWNGRRWRSCGVVPFTAEVPDNPEIVKLAVRGTTLLVAGGTLGPAVSTDRCASWSDRRSPIETTYQTGGTLENAVTSMTISGDRFVIAGFGGVGVTSDIGVTWHRGTIKPPEWTRRIAWSPSYDTDQTILLAQYGAGVVTSIDAGASFTATGQGLREPNVQMVAYPTDATDASLVFATHNHDLTRSDDGGATWTYPRSVATALALGVGAGERLWATSLENPRSTYAGGVAFSDDGGTNWASVSGLPSGWGTNEAVGAMDRAPLVCLYSLSEVICSTDDGVSWTSELASNGLPHLECPLGGDIDDMLIADGDGIWKRDGGGTWSLVHEGAVVDLAVADDGTWFAGDDAMALWRSDDGGISWSDLGVKFDSPFSTLSTHPQFADQPLLVVTTIDGLYTYQDGAVAPWARYQRADTETEFVQCEGCTETTDSDAGLGSIMEMSGGSRATVNLRGDTVSVVGRVDTLTQGTLWVDGVSAGTFRRTSVPLGGVIKRVSGLTDDWHVVELEITSGGPVDVDAFEGNGANTALATTARAKAMPASTYRPEAGAGCAAAGTRAGGWLLGALALGLATRRRSTPRG